MSERMVIVIEYDADFEPDGYEALNAAAQAIKASLSVPKAEVRQMYVAIRELAAAVVALFGVEPEATT